MGKSNSAPRNPKPKNVRKEKERERKVSRDWWFDGGPFLGGLNFGERAQAEAQGIAYEAETYAPVEPIYYHYGRAGRACTMMEGNDFVGSINVGASEAVKGDILYRKEINPLNFGNTRLGQFARMFERWCAYEIEFFYQPSANATESGSLALFADYDPSNPITTDSETNLDRAFAQYKVRATQVWQPQQFYMGKVDKYTDLFVSQTNHTLDLSAQGYVYVVAGSNIPANTACGLVWMKYRICFSISVLLPEAINAQYALQLDSVNPPTDATYRFGTAVRDADDNMDTDIVNNIDYTYTTVPGYSQFDFTNAPVGWYMMYVVSDGQFTTSSGSGAVDVHYTPSFVNCDVYVLNEGDFDFVSNVSGFAFSALFVSAYIVHTEETFWSISWQKSFTNCASSASISTSVLRLFSIGELEVNSLLKSKKPKFVEPLIVDHGYRLSDKSQALITRKELERDFEAMREQIVALKDLFNILTPGSVKNPMGGNLPPSSKGQVSSAKGKRKKKFIEVTDGSSDDEKRKDGDYDP